MSQTAFQSVFQEQAVGAVSAILVAPDLDSLWDVYYHSQRGENPAAEIAAALQDVQADLCADPALLVFMHRLVVLERSALEKRSGRLADENDAGLHRNLSDLESYLDALLRDVDAPALDDLPEAHQQLLSMLTHHTAQNPFRPVRTVLGLFRQTGAHIVEEAKEQPYAFATLLTASIGALVFMNARLGNSAALYLDPEVTTYMNFSLDALDDPSHVMQTDASFYNPDLGPSCHDHLKQLVGESVADFAKETLDLAGVFPQHCSRLKTLAQDAQGDLQAAYDFVNLRIGGLIKAPAENLASNLIPADSAFKRGFDLGTYHAAEFIYAANTVENVTLHTAIGLTASIMAYKAGTLENEETQEMRASVGDFVRRGLQVAPLNYVFAAAAVGYAYAANNGFSPEMVWMGLGGVLSGYFAHKAVRRRRRRDHAQTVTIHARDALSSFSTEDAHRLVVSNRQAHEGAEKPSWLMRFLKNKKTKAIGAVTGGLIAADMVATGGYYTGYVSGWGAVVVPFLGYNVVEDSFAHIVFGIGGGFAGLGAAAAVNGVRSARQPYHKYMDQKRFDKAIGQYVKKHSVKPDNGPSL